MTPFYEKAPRQTCVGRANGGALYHCAGACGDIPVVVLRGEPEAMGRQYGELLGAGILRNGERLLQLFADTGIPKPIVERLMSSAYERMAPHVPAAFEAEMQGIVSGAIRSFVPVSLDSLRRLVAATNFDMYQREQRILEILDADSAALLKEMNGDVSMQCTFFALWGSRTSEGKMLSLRNLDWVSQTGLHEDKLVVVYHPENKQPVVSMGYAGVIGCLAGMNASGLSFSEIGAFSVSEELDGIPWTFLARHVLETSDTLETAIDIVQNARHTIGYNYLVADGDPRRFGTDGFDPRAVAFETNHSCCEMFVDDDPKEHEAVWADADGTKHKYGLPLSDCILRADTAFARSTRALQATDNGPGAPENTGNPYGRDNEGSSYTTCHKPMHDMVRAYETGEAYVFPVRNQQVIAGGAPRKIGVDEALTIAAPGAHNTEMLAENDWNIMSVVYAPTDGQFWVGYETQYEDGSWKNAPDAGYTQFDMEQLLSL